jgi:hypothetical protein
VRIEKTPWFAIGKKAMSTPLTGDVPRGRGRTLLLLGIGLALLGVGLYVMQISLQRLMAPWYMPVLAVLGVFLVALSLRERRTVWRVLSLLAVVALAAAEIALLFAMRLPAYTGSIAAGKAFPTFEARLADGRGSAFTQQDLLGDQTNALVFFRGRW